ncbi:hypothetical protein V5799_019568 [Amblyomma americanum]|uniref:Uncharacterized protein n=1 Tax=Amblyomma americanum TaxID=6943 RepID=A0AAQ4EW48_AMBAM
MLDNVQDSNTTILKTVFLGVKLHGLKTSTQYDEKAVAEFKTLRTHPNAGHAGEEGERGGPSEQEGAAAVGRVRRAAGRGRLQRPSEEGVPGAPVLPAIRGAQRGGGGELRHAQATVGEETMTTRGLSLLAVQCSS